MLETLLPGMAVLKSNVHPMLIHFPIAFFFGALAMEGMAILRMSRPARRFLTSVIDPQTLKTQPGITFSCRKIRIPPKRVYQL
jgi:hypothetical protein